jgi:hypothetical protein
MLDAASIDAVVNSSRKCLVYHHSMSCEALCLRKQVKQQQQVLLTAVGGVIKASSSI